MGGRETIMAGTILAAVGSWVILTAGVTPTNNFVTVSSASFDSQASCIKYLNAPASAHPEQPYDVRQCVKLSRSLYKEDFTMTTRLTYRSM